MLGNQSPALARCGAHLIVAVHHLQPPARLLLLHVPQGTLQAEDNIFILLYNLHKRAEVVGGRSAVMLQTVAMFSTQCLFSYGLNYYTWILLQGSGRRCKAQREIIQDV